MDKNHIEDHVCDPFDNVKSTVGGTVIAGLAVAGLVFEYLPVWPAVGIFGFAVHLVWPNMTRKFLKRIRETIPILRE